MLYKIFLQLFLNSFVAIYFDFWPTIYACTRFATTYLFSDQNQKCLRWGEVKKYP